MDLRRLAGVVTNPDGAVSAATIEATQVSTSNVFAATSGASGRYTWTNLPEGAHQLVVPRLGINTLRFVQQPAETFRPTGC